MGPRARGLAKPSISAFGFATVVHRKLPPQAPAGLAISIHTHTGP